MKEKRPDTTSLNKKQRRYIPRLIAWEVTRRCILKCLHCRAAAREEPFEDELTTGESFRLIDSISAHYKPVLILTGGEPLLRDDIFEIIRYGDSKGLRMVLATCGVRITRDTVIQMKESGIKRISISIDGADAQQHDRVRGVSGAFDAALSAARYAREEGLEFQVNTTVTRRNMSELEAILHLAIDLGAVAYHPFLLVPTGRGRELADESLSPEEYEDILTWIYDQQNNVPLTIKPTCAPHYQRIVRQRRDREDRKISRDQGGMENMPRGCLGGRSFAFISYNGTVQICGFLDVECGALRDVQFDFKRIWDFSPVFQDVRQTERYGGRCGYCEFRHVCGGCRARAYFHTGDYLAEEPLCLYQPPRRTASTKR